MNKHDRGKWMLVVVALLIVGVGGLWLRGQSPTKESISKQETAVKLVSPQEFKQLAQNSEVFILDVHTPEQTHIPGTDAFIPDDQIGENLDQLPQDKTVPILIYCRSGNMSARAAKELVQLGYSQVYDLDGGTNAFKEQQVSVEFWPAKQELGTVVYGDIARLSYTLTNYTPLPLKITRVSTSCGCTSAEVENETLGAYQSTQVNVQFDPAVHKDDTDLGELSRTIYLETDNPNFPELEAGFSATVIKQ